MDNISLGGGWGDVQTSSTCEFQYDFNKVQLSGRGRKELPIICLGEKL